MINISRDIAHVFASVTLCARKALSARYAPRPNGNEAAVLMSTSSIGAPALARNESEIETQAIGGREAWSGVREAA
jgi:hypothetical protein